MRRALRSSSSGIAARVSWTRRATFRRRWAGIFSSNSRKGLVGITASFSFAVSPDAGRKADRQAGRISHTSGRRRSCRLLSGGWRRAAGQKRAAFLRASRALCAQFPHLCVTRPAHFGTMREAEGGAEFLEKPHGAGDVLLLILCEGVPPEAEFNSMPV